MKKQPRLKRERLWGVFFADAGRMSGALVLDDADGSKAVAVYTLRDNAQQRAAMNGDEKFVAEVVLVRARQRSARR